VSLLYDELLHFDNGGVGQQFDIYKYYTMPSLTQPNFLLPYVNNKEFGCVLCNIYVCHNIRTAGWILSNVDSLLTILNLPCSGCTENCLIVPLAYPGPPPPDKIPGYATE
jgi:hypothetical protein